MDRWSGGGGGGRYGARLAGGGGEGDSEEDGPAGGGSRRGGASQALSGDAYESPVGGYDSDGRTQVSGRSFGEASSSEGPAGGRRHGRPAASRTLTGPVRIRVSGRSFGEVSEEEARGELGRLAEGESEALAAADDAAGSDSADVAAQEAGAGSPPGSPAGLGADAEAEAEAEATERAAATPSHRVFFNGRPAGFWMQAGQAATPEPGAGKDAAAARPGPGRFGRLRGRGPANPPAVRPDLERFQLLSLPTLAAAVAAQPAAGDMRDVVLAPPWADGGAGFDARVKRPPKSFISSAVSPWKNWMRAAFSNSSGATGSARAVYITLWTSRWGKITAGSTTPRRPLP